MEQIKIPTKTGIFGLYLIVRNAIFPSVKTRSIMTSHFYKRSIIPLTIALFLIMLPRITLGQTYGSANHRVTVIVNPITVMSVAPIAVNLNIPDGPTAIVIAGLDQMTVTDQTSILRWGTNYSLRKVTISTSLTTPIFRLQVVAYNIVATPSSAGSPVAQFDVTDLDHDLIRDIARSSGHCNLLYTGIANASSGVGNDSHTLTLTIVAQ